MHTQCRAVLQRLHGASRSVFAKEHLRRLRGVVPSVFARYHHVLLKRLATIEDCARFLRASCKRRVFFVCLVRRYANFAEAHQYVAWEGGGTGGARCGDENQTKLQQEKRKVRGPCLPCRTLPPFLRSGWRPRKTSLLVRVPATLYNQSQRRKTSLFVKKRASQEGCTLRSTTKCNAQRCKMQEDVPFRERARKGAHYALQPNAALYAPWYALRSSRKRCNTTITRLNIFVNVFP